MSEGLWRAVVPPYRMLDPGLALAEAVLVNTLAELCAVLPDEERASKLLNEALLRAGSTHS